LGWQHLEGGTVEIDENGVVNPLRVPSPVRDVAARVGGVPPLGRALIVLAGVDLALAMLRGGGGSLFAIGEALLVLLPVAVLWRRSDAAIATPAVLRGTLLIAVAVLASGVFRAIDAWLPTAVIEPDALGTDVPHLVGGLAILLVTALGWWMVATSIAGLRPSRKGWQRMAGMCTAAAAIATAIGFLALELLASDSHPPASTIVLVSIDAASWLVTAYVGWVFVSRAGGAPRWATRSAAAGAAIWAAGSIPTLLISLTLFLTRDEGLLSGQGVGIWILSLASVLPPFLFVLAFAFGLADREADIPTAASLPGRG
jgi:hypothetical protein